MTPIETTALQTTAKTAEGLLGKLLGPSADIYGQILASGAQMQFLKNQIKNFKKVQKIVDDDNINIKQVNVKVLFPYLNGVALEEDETLQDMWANLFVNYIDTTKNLTVIVYPDILKQLSTNEVVILKYVNENKAGIRTGFQRSKDVLFNSDEIANLSRLGLISEQKHLFKDHYIDEITNEKKVWKEEIGGVGEYILTSFGKFFLKACSME